MPDLSPIMCKSLLADTLDMIGLQETSFKLDKLHLLFSLLRLLLFQRNNFSEYPALLT